MAFYLKKYKNSFTVLKKTENYRNVVCVGRTHGMHAEPTTLGLKFAGFYTEFKRGFQK